MSHDHDTFIPAQWELVGSGHKGGKLYDLRHQVSGPGPELKDNNFNQNPSLSNLTKVRLRINNSQEGLVVELRS